MDDSTYRPTPELQSRLRRALRGDEESAVPGPSPAGSPVPGSVTPGGDGLEEAWAMFADSDTKRPAQPTLPQRPLSAVEDLDRSAKVRGPATTAQPAWFDRSVGFGADRAESSESFDSASFDPMSRFDRPQPMPTRPNPIAPVGDIPVFGTAAEAADAVGRGSGEPTQTAPAVPTSASATAERTAAMTSPMGPGPSQPGVSIPPVQPSLPQQPSAAGYAAPTAAAPVADSSMVTDWPSRDAAYAQQPGPVAQGQSTFVPPAPPSAPNRRIGWLLAATLLAALLVIALLWAFRPDSSPTDNEEVTTTTIAGLDVTPTTTPSAVRFPDSPIVLSGDFTANASLITFDVIQRTKTLVISNDTTGPVTWASSVSGTAGVTLSPANGTLPAGGSQFVQVERTISAVTGTNGVIELTRSDRLTPISVDVAFR